MMLYKILCRMNRTCFEPIVVSLMNKEKIGRGIEAIGVPVYSLGMHAGIPNPLALFELLTIVRKVKPDIIQGWMYHGNLAATVASGFSRKQIPVLWNIRHSLYDLGKEKLITQMVIRMNALFSHTPATTIYNSRNSTIQHIKFGFRAEKNRIIPNGFDTIKFRPDSKLRQCVRAELEISDETILIGLIARYHPMKDHANFLRAASILLKSTPDVRFLLAGRGVDMGNNKLLSMVFNLGLDKHVMILGERDDIQKLNTALDIASSSSWSEGFSNVVGEAMACGVPCVVTDVGDSAWIVGNTGKVVPPRDAIALANAWKDLISIGVEKRRKMGKMARIRVKEYFSLTNIAAQYEQLYTEVLRI